MADSQLDEDRIVEEFARAIEAANKTWPWTRDYAFIAQLRRDLVDCLKIMIAEKSDVDGVNIASWVAAYVMGHKRGEGKKEESSQRYWYPDPDPSPRWDYAYIHDICEEMLRRTKEAEERQRKRSSPTDPKHGGEPFYYWQTGPRPGPRRR